MSTTATHIVTSNARRHIAFVALITVSVISFHKILTALVESSLQDPSRSHIILIPVVSSFLLFIERRTIFSVMTASIAPGISLVLAGFVLEYVAGRNSFLQGGSWLPAIQAFSMILVWVGLFLACFGSAALRTGAFPLLFLLLMVPLPDVVLDRIVHALQEGSSEIAYLLFRAVGTPVLRQGFLLSVPGVTIEVAKECSSIRSSVALFITCLLAAHLYLRKSWKTILFALLSVPLSVIKNGIRIATLTLLSMYVDPSFLTGKLHRDGGFVFFLMALLILWPIFSCLAKSDKQRESVRSIS